jgi:hypothetical protein
MHGRLRAIGVVVLVVCGLALASGVAGQPDEQAAPGHHSALVAGWAHLARQPVPTRPTRSRLPSLVALLAALLLAVRVGRRSDRPRALLRLAEAASIRAPSRAPPALQNVAF